jgi:hypothetical protein
VRRGREMFAAQVPEVPELRGRDRRPMLLSSERSIAKRLHVPRSLVDLFQRRPCDSNAVEASQLASRLVLCGNFTRFEEPSFAAPDSHGKKDQRSDYEPHPKNYRCIADRSRRQGYDRVVDNPEQGK